MVVDDTLSIRLGARLLRDPLVVLSPALVRLKLLDDWSDEGKTELRDLGSLCDLRV